MPEPGLSRPCPCFSDRHPRKTARIRLAYKAYLVYSGPRTFDIRTKRDTACTHPSTENINASPCCNFCLSSHLQRPRARLSLLVAVCPPGASEIGFVLWASGPWQMESNRLHPPVHVYLSISLRTPSPSGSRHCNCAPACRACSNFPAGRFWSISILHVGPDQPDPRPNPSPTPNPMRVPYRQGQKRCFFQNRRTKNTTTGRAFGACPFCIYSYPLVSMFLSFIFSPILRCAILGVQQCLFSFFSRLETPESTFRVSRNVTVDQTRCCSSSDLVSINPR